MIEASLNRTDTSDEGTFGMLTVCGWSCHTLELPWRDNLPGRSCIPAGEYRCGPWSSRRFSRAYHVQGVPGREAILIHTGNFAGDTAKGLRSNVQGCILVGQERGFISRQAAVLYSRAAMNELARLLGQEPFTLTIREVA